MAFPLSSGFFMRPKTFKGWGVPVLFAHEKKKTFSGKWDSYETCVGDTKYTHLSM